MTPVADFVSITWGAKTVRLEYLFLGTRDYSEPLIVFMHEGLGSLSMWRDFPARLCSRLNCRGLVFSRPGYGRSTPLDFEHFWGTDFMHRQAYEVLPSVLQALEIDNDKVPIWIFGHSDGASIGLLYGATLPTPVEGLIVMAPHIFVEDITLQSIQIITMEYQSGKLQNVLARHHENPRSTFEGWSRIWLDPEFKLWNIKAELANISVPILAIQGTNDEYGTFDQIAGIKEVCDQTLLLEIPDCGHSPLRMHSDVVLHHSVEFIR